MQTNSVKIEDVEKFRDLCERIENEDLAGDCDSNLEAISWDMRNSSYRAILFVCITLISNCTDLNSSTLEYSKEIQEESAFTEKYRGKIVSKKMFYLATIVGFNFGVLLGLFL